MAKWFRSEPMSYIVRSTKQQRKRSWIAVIRADPLDNIIALIGMTVAATRILTIDCTSFCPYRALS